MDELLLEVSIITHMFVNKLIRVDEEGILYIRGGLTLASVSKHEHPIRIGMIPAFIQELGYKLFRYTGDKRRE